MESTTQIFLLVQVSGSESDVVEGESYVGRYARRVQINDFEFGMSAKPQSGPKRSNAVVNNLDFDTVSVGKFFDKASIRFAELLKQQTVLTEVRITVDQQLEEDKVKEQNAIIVFHLLQARIVDIKLDVTEQGTGASLKETISFSFRNFAVEYYYKDTKDSDYRDKAAWFETEYVPQDT